MKMTVEEFIEKHEHINYCEAIIHSDGLIEYVSPSHTETLIQISGETKEDLYNKIKPSESVLDFMVDYTKAIAVWSNGYVLPYRTLIRPARTLQKLIDSGLVSRNCYNKNTLAYRHQKDKLERLKKEMEEY